MAASRKDVELVIRARDQAAKALDTIAKAANNLVENVDEIGKSGAGVDSALGRLGAAVASLDKAFKGLSTEATLTKQFDRATEASARLEKGMQETAAEGSRLAKELERASHSATELAAKTAQAAAELQRQGAAVKSAKAAQSELNRTLNESIAARDKLITAEKRLSDSLAKQPGRIQAAQERFDRLSEAMRATAEPTATLQKRFEAAVSSLAKAEGRLSGLSNELETTRAAIVSANTGIETLGQALAQSNSRVEQAKVALSNVKAEYRDLGAAAKTAAKEQKALANAQADIAEALNRQQGEFEQSKSAMSELVTEQGRVQAAMAELAAEARGPLLQAFSQQQRAMSQINNAFQANRKNIAELGAEMGRVGVPTREMVESYNRLLITSNQIRSEYAQQRAALSAMREALRAGVTDTAQLQAIYQRFSTTLDGSAAALGRVQASVARTNAANAQAAASAERTAAAVEREGRATRESAGGKSRAAAETDKFSAALRRLYGESRQAMSMTQRLRGEVLSLIAAYGGIYGVINVLGQVVIAYQALEAATSRLNVVNSGDQEKTANDLDFVRRTAQRLGIEFASLAQEYSKFSVATQGTNLEGANTRKIFVAVAEAARVNKVSTEEMAGTFVALTQIVSKGSVQMEELRQQLGDRLPGALQIMAAGLGVTTEKLIEMTANGEVSSDALVGFAEELTRRFGPQLAGALDTTSSQLGMLQNQVTQTLLAFGQSGFIRAFTDLIRDLNEVMASSDFQTFVARISQGVAGLIDLLGTFVENWQLVAAALAAVAAIRLAPVLILLGNAVVDLGRKAVLASVMMERASKATIATGAASTVAATGLGRLAVAFRALLSSTGIGLLLTVVTTGLTLWATGTDRATDAMNKHRSMIDEVKDAYEAAGGAVTGWETKLRNFSVTASQQLTSELQRVRRDLQFEMSQLAEPTRNSQMNMIELTQVQMNGDERSRLDQIKLLTDEFIRGIRPVEEYRSALDLIGSTTQSEGIRRTVVRMLELVTAQEEAKDAIAEQEAAQRAANGTATDADRILLGLKDAAEAASAAFDASALETFTDAMREMAGFIPELEAGLKTLKDIETINAAYDAAVSAANLSVDRNLLVAAATQQRDAAITAVLSAQDAAVFKEIAGNTKVTQDMFNQVFGEENFRTQAYDDGYGNPTIGYGSTTVGGRPVQMGDSITQENAMREAVAEIARLVAYIEGAVKVPLSKSQMEALVSYTYNAGPGSLARDGILDVLNRGDYGGAASAIRTGVNTSNGVFSQGLQDRREREADLFSSGMQDPEIIRELAQIEQERLQTAEDYHAALALTAEQQQREIDLAAEGIIQRETTKALAEAELAAKEAGTVLTAEEIEGIKTRTAALFAEQAAEEAKTQVQERQAAVEQKVNDLLTQRTELENQLAIQRESGDAEGADATEQAILAINTQLKEAIANAIAMHEAIGGTTADAAIAKLQTLNMEAARLDVTGKQNQITWGQVQTLFAGGLTNAIMGFAQAVANGEDAGEAARTAFLQFAADFLIKIAEMIIQQAILNALQSAFGGGGGNFLAGLFGTGHSGGIVGSKRIGSGNGTRMLSPAIFAAAPRYHEGGIVGLKPGEVPAVLQENEEVLTRDDPRHALNGGAAGGGSASPVNLKIINTIDSGSFVSEGLNTTEGEEAIFNLVRNNPSKFRSMLGV